MDLVAVELYRVKGNNLGGWDYLRMRDRFDALEALKRYCPNHAEISARWVTMN